MKPTPETYAELQHAYDVFNLSLFEDKLPECLITLQRNKNTCGYFLAERFINRNGQCIDEIAINPSLFAVTPIVEVMQTLVHEMAHLWQHHFGEPGRGRYHNVQWADKMEGIGLMPSSTGKPGGARTGDHMADYALPNGRFLLTCIALLDENFKLSWYDRFPPRDIITFGMQSHTHALDLPQSATSNVLEQYQNQENFDEYISTTPITAPAGNKSNRVKYSCECGLNVWGKPLLKIRCEECMALFLVE